MPLLAGLAGLGFTAPSLPLHPAAMSVFLNSPSAASPQRCCFTAPLEGNVSAVICMTPSSNISQQLADDPITKARWGAALGSIWGMLGAAARLGVLEASSKERPRR